MIYIKRPKLIILSSRTPNMLYKGLGNKCQIYFCYCLFAYFIGLQLRHLRNIKVKISKTNTEMSEG